MLFLMIFSIILTPSSPEDLLNELCENSRGMNGAEFWSAHASDEVQSSQSDPDSLLQILDGMHDLTVAAGDRTSFEDRGNSFRIEFGNSVWTWFDENGRLNRTEGMAIVLCNTGTYSWMEIPVLTSGSISIGPKERIVSGIMVTILVLIFASILLVWAKRRFL